MRAALSFLLLPAAALAAACVVPAQDRSSRLAPADAKSAPFDEADLNERVTPEVKAVRRAEHSVVSIYVVATDQLARRRAAMLSGSEVQGQGSGVIIDANGMVITNWHVIAAAAARPDAFELQVRLRNRKQYGARILNASREHDLALLQLDLPSGDEVKPVAIGDSGTLMVGETVIAIGNPQGHANTVTRGVLSATDREIAARTPDGGMLRLQGLLQTDAAINQGNSGGALLDITGRLIGINNAMAANAENIGFAIPVNTVQRVFHELLVGSASFSLWLGLQVDEKDGELVVTSVDPMGPAAQAGLQRGDRLVAAGERPVSSAVDYARALVNAEPGHALPLAVRRGSRQLALAPVPMTRAMGVIARAIGATIEEVQDRQVVAAASVAYSRDLRRRVRLPAVLRVAGVAPEGTAAATDLRAGDILLYYVERSPWGSNRQPFLNTETLAQLLTLARRSELYIGVLRGDEVLEGPLSVR